ncbi:MAG: DNA-processing protein DprA, partial [bacterium]|nr:DNA-processing protein DprA [bacterium]
QALSTAGGTMIAQNIGAKKYGRVSAVIGVSMLADAVIVIEARRKSGTLITVDMALEQGREVYALPGRVTDALSGGCNALIAQGAGIATSPKQLLEALADTFGREIIPPAKNTGPEQACFGNDKKEKPGDAAESAAGDAPEGAAESAERQIYALLSEEGQTFDMLMSRSALAPGGFAAALMQLCVSGRAVCRQGRYYRKDAEE